MEISKYFNNRQHRLIFAVFPECADRAAADAGGAVRPAPGPTAGEGDRARAGADRHPA